MAGELVDLWAADAREQPHGATQSRLPSQREHRPRGVPRIRREWLGEGAGDEDPYYRINNSNPAVK